MMGDEHVYLIGLPCSDENHEACHIKTCDCYCHIIDRATAHTRALIGFMYLCLILLAVVVVLWVTLGLFVDSR